MQRVVRDVAVAGARLRDAAEGAKRRLSEVESAGVALVDLPLGGGRTGNLELSLGREEAEF